MFIAPRRSRQGRQPYHPSIHQRPRPVAQSQPARGNVHKLVTHRGFVITLSLLAICALSFGYFNQGHDNTTPAGTTTSHNSSSTRPAVAGSSTENSGFDKNARSTTDPQSLWLVVNKKHPLSPKTYVPANLVVPDIPLRSNITSTEKYVRADMAKALENMVNDAASQGVHFNLQSGYRSYSFQVTLYNGYVQSQGQAVADRQSARPGYSEHQTGLAADLGGTTKPACNVEACYADTPEGTWLAANAYRYGFIVRYPSDKEPVTGYLYEPWHVRYIGTDLSAELHSQHIETLEEFFGMGAAPTY